MEKLYTNDSYPHGSHRGVSPALWEKISHGQSPVGAVIRVESSRFLLTGYVNLEASQTAIVGISGLLTPE
ncbi:hypothetical protein Bca101_061356 [Brassica carinata]